MPMRASACLPIPPPLFSAVEPFYIRLLERQYFPTEIAYAHNHTHAHAQTDTRTHTHTHRQRYTLTQPYTHAQTDSHNHMPLRPAQPHTHTHTHTHIHTYPTNFARAQRAGTNSSGKVNSPVRPLPGTLNASSGCVAGRPGHAGRQMKREKRRGDVFRGGEAWMGGKVWNITDGMERNYGYTTFTKLRLQIQT